MSDDNLQAVTAIASAIDHLAEVAATMGPRGAELAESVHNGVADWNRSMANATGSATDGRPPTTPSGLPGPINAPQRLLHVVDLSGDTEQFDDTDDEDDEYDDGGDLEAAEPPHKLVLHVRRDSGFPLSMRDAQAAVAAVLPSIVEVLGEATIDDESAVLDDDDPALVHVSVTLPGSGLTRVGAGRDGFNAQLPLAGVGSITITSLTVDNTNDEDTEEQTDPEPDPAGYFTRHFNGDSDGDDAIGIDVTYHRVDGAPLSNDDVQNIINHPISAGLRRLGNLRLREITVDDDPSTRVAHFDVLTTGEDINTTSLAVGATVYRGTFDFGGTLGQVHAEASAA